MKVQITKSYASECGYVSLKGESVTEWLKNYSNRNKIPFSEVSKTYSDDTEAEQFQLEFKSDPQYQAFLRIASHNFPFFEFV